MQANAEICMEMKPLPQMCVNPEMSENPGVVLGPPVALSGSASPTLCPPFLPYPTDLL
jgi:hypothetical protein